MTQGQAHQPPWPAPGFSDGDPLHEPGIAPLNLHVAGHMEMLHLLQVAQTEEP